MIDAEAIKIADRVYHAKRPGYVGTVMQLHRSGRARVAWDAHIERDVELARGPRNASAKRAHVMIANLRKVEA